MRSRNRTKPAAAKQAPGERMVLAVEERRDTVLRVIGSAKQRVRLSLFRCTDFKILDALGEALQRKVQVQLLMTPRAKGWKKRLRELAGYLEGMGAEMRKYAGSGKYHAKYVVADDGPALVTSLNFTRKCFGDSCDFILQTYDREVIEGLTKLFDADWRAPDSSFPKGISDRLIVSPERSRTPLSQLLRQARDSIRIIDHKVDDPAMLALLEAKRAEGVAVQVRGRGDLGGLLSHGRMILVDDTKAVIGSISLSPVTLDSRREVAILIRDPGCVAQLNEFFESLPAPGAAPRGPKQEDEEEDEEEEEAAARKGSGV